MQKYSSNRWWESDDPVTIAKNQFAEPRLLSPMSVYKQGLSIITGRDIYTHDFALDKENLKREVELGLRRLEKGLKTSDEYKEHATRRSIEILSDYCQRTGKKLVSLDLSQSPDRDEKGIDTSGYDGWLQ